MLCAALDGDVDLIQGSVIGDTVSLGVSPSFAALSVFQLTDFAPQKKCRRAWDSLREAVDAMKGLDRTLEKIWSSPVNSWLNEVRFGH